MQERRNAIIRYVALMPWQIYRLSGNIQGGIDELILASQESEVEEHSEEHCLVHPVLAHTMHFTAVIMRLAYQDSLE